MSHLAVPISFESTSQLKMSLAESLRFRATRLCDGFRVVIFDGPLQDHAGLLVKSERRIPRAQLYGHSQIALIS